MTVTDDHTGVTPTSLLNGDGFNVGDTNEDGKLDTNETWIYTAAGVAIDGAYTNKGTASGSFTDSAGHTATPTASDSSGYIGVNPAIAIDKVTTGVDSVTVVNGVVTSMHTSTGDGLSFLAGYGVTWTYTVTNSGDVALANVAVTDDQPGVSPTAVLQGDHVHNVGDINDNGLLDVGELDLHGLRDLRPRQLQQYGNGERVVYRYGSSYRHAYSQRFLELYRHLHGAGRHADTGILGQSYRCLGWDAGQGKQFNQERL